MNKAYRIVWNARTNTWTAVQENAKAKGKSSSGRVSAEPATLGSLGLKSSRFVCTALASALMMTAGYANAGPGIYIMMVPMKDVSLPMIHRWMEMRCSSM